jgi:hypothetical protein
VPVPCRVINNGHKSMTKKEMADHLKRVGITKDFRVTWDGLVGEGVILFHARYTIINGIFKGTRIDLHPNDTIVQIWTSSKKKAKVYALAHDCKVRLLDGEAILYVPGTKADALLPRFGAKVRRVPTPAQLEVIARGLNSLKFKANAARRGGV